MMLIEKQFFAVVVGNVITWKNPCCGHAGHGPVRYLVSHVFRGGLVAVVPPALPPGAHPHRPGDAGRRRIGAQVQDLHQIHYKRKGFYLLTYLQFIRTPLDIPESCCCCADAAPMRRRERHVRQRVAVAPTPCPRVPPPRPRPISRLPPLPLSLLRRFRLAVVVAGRRRRPRAERRAPPRSSSLASAEDPILVLDCHGVT